VIDLVMDVMHESSGVQRQNHGLTELRGDPSTLAERDADVNQKGHR
jgi:hypothetical protein